MKNRTHFKIKELLERHFNFSKFAVSKIKSEEYSRYISENYPYLPLEDIHLTEEELKQEIVKLDPFLEEAVSSVAEDYNEKEAAFISIEATLDEYLEVKEEFINTIRGEIEQQDLRSYYIFLLELLLKHKEDEVNGGGRPDYHLNKDNIGYIKNIVSKKYYTDQ